MGASLRRNGCPRFVEVEDLPVQPAVLVEIAAGDLEAGRVLDAACLDRLEPGGADQTFGCRRGNLVVGRIEEATRRGVRSASAASDGAPSVPNAFT